MITVEQRRELMWLASKWATAPAERAGRAYSNLFDYLDSLTDWTSAPELVESTTT